MKQYIYLVVLVLALGLTGCGIQDQVNELKKQQTNQNEQIEDLNRRVLLIENLVSLTISMINTDSIKLQGLESQLNQLSDKESNDYLLLQNQIASTLSNISTIQTIVTTQTTTLVTLQTNENITVFHDFCGNKPGFYNEVGMITSSGKIVVYFETGGSRFLSILQDGSYMTSDGTACYFTVTNGGTVITNEHY